MARPKKNQLSTMINQIINNNKSKAPIGRNNFFKSISSYPLLTREEEVQAGKDLKSNNPKVVEEARNKLIRSNIRLVISNARKSPYSGKGMDFMDLIEEGIIGLSRATETFDVDKGFRFSTYAVPWIRQRMGKAAIYTDRDIYVPTHAREEIRKLNIANDQLKAELKRNPTTEELAKKALLNKYKKEGKKKIPSTEDIKNMELRIGKFKSYILPMDSMDATLTSDDGSSTTLEDTLPDIQNEPLDVTLINDSLKKDLLSAIKTLPPRSNIIMTMSYGLNSLHKVYPPEVIAQKLGVSKDRLRNVQAEAYKRLNHPARKYEIKKYINEKDDTKKVRA